MIKGSHSSGEIEFYKFLAPNFIPSMQMYSCVRGSCGTMALAMLTGHKQSRIAAALPKRAYEDSWTDVSIKKYLTTNGYTVYPLTIAAVTHSEYLHYPIKQEHVVLMSQHMLRYEGSWAIMHNDFYYHNFEKRVPYANEFINNPINTAYIVYHKKWA